MNIKLFILIIICISTLQSATCLNEVEKKDVLILIKILNEHYSDVPNYIQCNKKENLLEEFVCKNKDYLLMFRLLSMVHLYAWENATKKEYNHQTWNKIHMTNYWAKDSNTSNLDPNQLCFNLKEETLSLHGDYLSPYTKINLWEKIFFLQKYSDKLILTDNKGYKIYLHTTSKASDSNNKQGYWYCENGKYNLKLNSKKGFFYGDNCPFRNIKLIIQQSKKITNAGIDKAQKAIEKQFRNISISTK